MIGTLLRQTPHLTNDKLVILEELVDINRPLASNENAMDFAACELRGLLRRPENDE